MNDHIKISDDILLYAFRYSLNRQTNAPVKVMDSIIHNIKNISTINIEKIITEIENCSSFGFSFHKNTWFGLLDDLKFELKVRKLQSN